MPTIVAPQSSANESNSGNLIDFWNIYQQADKISESDSGAIYFMQYNRKWLFIDFSNVLLFWRIFA